MSHNPDKGAHNPDKGAHNSDKGAHNPDKGAHNPDKGEPLEVIRWVRSISKRPDRGGLLGGSGRHQPASSSAQSKFFLLADH